MGRISALCSKGGGAISGHPPNDALGGGGNVYPQKTNECAAKYENFPTGNFFNQADYSHFTSEIQGPPYLLILC